MIVWKKDDKYKLLKLGTHVNLNLINLYGKFFLELKNASYDQVYLKM